jgi:hypothetical protein
MQFVHVSCLNKLRQTSHKNYMQCPTCHYKYGFERLVISRILIHPVTITFFTVVSILFIFACIYAFLFQVAYIIGILLSATRLTRVINFTWRNIVSSLTTMTFIIVGMLGILVATLLQEDGDVINIADIVYDGFTMRTNYPSLFTWGTVDIYLYSSVGWAGLFVVLYRSVRDEVHKAVHRRNQYIINIE